MKIVAFAGDRESRRAHRSRCSSLPLRKNAIGVRSVISTRRCDWAGCAARWRASTQGNRFESGLRRWLERNAQHAVVAVARQTVSEARSRAARCDFRRFNLIGLQQQPSAASKVRSARKTPQAVMAAAPTTVHSEHAPIKRPASPPNFLRRISSGFCRRRYFGSSSASSSGR